MIPLLCVLVLGGALAAFLAAGIYHDQFLNWWYANKATLLRTWSWPGIWPYPVGALVFTLGDLILFWSWVDVMPSGWLLWNAIVHTLGIVVLVLIWVIPVIKTTKKEKEQ